MKENINTLKKEVSFKILTDISEIHSIDSDDSLIVQGTIDAFFEDSDGSIILVDYKTDKIPKDGINIIAQRYRIQLETYAKALEKIFNKKVKEKYIYLFDNGETISI